MAAFGSLAHASSFNLTAILPVAPGCSSSLLNTDTSGLSSRSSPDPRPRYYTHEAVAETQGLVDCNFKFVVHGVPLLPPRRPVGANNKDNIPLGSELEDSAWPAGHLSCNKAEVRSVGFVRTQVS